MKFCLQRNKPREWRVVVALRPCKFLKGLLWLLFHIYCQDLLSNTLIFNIDLNRYNNDYNKKLLYFSNRDYITMCLSEVLIFYMP